MSRRILILDHSPLLRRIGGGILRREISACHVETSDKAVEGLAAARERRPDAILLDGSLPGMDEVCDRLADGAETANVPIVLLYSNGADIAALRHRFPNIRAALHKPLLTEKLVQTVNAVLNSTAAADEDFAVQNGHLPATLPVVLPDVLFSGTTGMIPLPRVFGDLENEARTGVLRVFAGERPAEIYFSGGKILFCSTRDLALYCRDSPARIPRVEKSVLDEARRAQRTGGCPFFLVLRDRDLLIGAEATNLVRDHGQRLFSRLWLAPRAGFEFERLAALPGFAEGFPMARDSAGGWLLKTLRYLVPDRLPQNLRAAPEAVPAVSPCLETLQPRLRWTADERAFLREVDGARPLHEIASRAGFAPLVAGLLLFRFVALGALHLRPSAP